MITYGKLRGKQDDFTEKRGKDANMLRRFLSADKKFTKLRIILTATLQWFNYNRIACSTRKRGSATRFVSCIRVV